MVCLGTSVDAFFDYPFYRPENILLYSVALGILFREGKLLSFNENLIPKLFFKCVLIIFLCFQMFVTIKMSVGLGARKYWTSSSDIKYLKIAHNFWPWDVQWRSHHLSVFNSEGEKDYAQKYAVHRLKAWPNDPESYLSYALWARSQGDYPNAIEFYRRAIKTVENGFCYWPGYRSYKEMEFNPKYPSDGMGIAKSELALCE